MKGFCHIAPWLIDIARVCLGCDWGWEKALTLPSRQGCVLIALEKRDVVEGARREQRSRRTPLGDHDRGKGARGCRRRTGGGQRVYSREGLGVMP